MAFYTVEKRATAKGVIRYRVTVGVKENGKYTHRESMTFPKAPLAHSWGAQRVADIEAGGLDRKQQGITLRGLLTRYLNDSNMKKGKDKIGSLNRVARTTLADTPVSELVMARYVEYSRMRRATVTASSLSTELYYLKTALETAQPFYGIEVPLNEFSAAMTYLSRLNVIGPSNKRTRRPTREEFNLLHAGLVNSSRKSRKKIRYHDVFEFAVYSCMRRGEICRIDWADVDEKTRSVLVRDRKDPRKKEGNHMVVPLLGRAWEIIQEQPTRTGRIFPFHPQTITYEFKRVKDELRIPDIRLHDMKREAASRLFELGFSVEEVAQVTGHKNLKTLWTVYREIYPESLHDRFNYLTASRTNS